MACDPITETLISNGNGGFTKIHPGDEVEIIPAEVTVRTHCQPDDENYAYYLELERRAYKDLIGWVGDRRCTIAWIGKWPCGRVNLYFPNGFGAPSTDFMKQVS